MFAFWLHPDRRRRTSSGSDAATETLHRADRWAAIDLTRLGYREIAVRYDLGSLKVGGDFQLTPDGNLATTSGWSEEQTVVPSIFVIKTPPRSLHARSLAVRYFKFTATHASVVVPALQSTLIVVVPPSPAEYPSAQYRGVIDWVDDVV